MNKSTKSSCTRFTKYTQSAYNTNIGMWIYNLITALMNKYFLPQRVNKEALNVVE